MVVTTQALTKLQVVFDFWYHLLLPQPQIPFCFFLAPKSPQVYQFFFLLKYLSSKIFFLSFSLKHFSLLSRQKDHPVWITAHCGMNGWRSTTEKWLLKKELGRMRQIPELGQFHNVPCLLFSSIQTGRVWPNNLSTSLLSPTHMWASVQMPASASGAYKKVLLS